MDPNQALKELLNLLAEENTNDFQSEEARRTEIESHINALWLWINNGGCIPKLPTVVQFNTLFLQHEEQKHDMTEMLRDVSSLFVDMSRDDLNSFEQVIVNYLARENLLQYNIILERYEFGPRLLKGKTE